MRTYDDMTADAKAVYDSIVSPAFRARERAHWQARQQRLAAKVVLRAAQRSSDEADDAFDAEVHRAWVEVDKLGGSEQMADPPGH